MKSYTITLGGQSFQIRSDADAEHVKALSQGIALRYDALKKNGPRSSQEFRAMAMVAIVLADELREMKEQRDDIRNKAREFATELISHIDKILTDDAI